MKFILFAFLAILVFVFPLKSFASSSYVLPYPSVMPGSFSYKIHQIYELALKFWYFGDFGQFEYNLKESDKYLVESKTLFEYNQYLLGYNSLIKSDEYFVKAKPDLVSAKNHGKNTTDKEKLLEQASQKHQEVLEILLKELPTSVNWSPEKQKSSILNLADKINASILIRISNK